MKPVLMANVSMFSHGNLLHSTVQNRNAKGIKSLPGGFMQMTKEQLCRPQVGSNIRLGVFTFKWNLINKTNKQGKYKQRH